MLSGGPGDYVVSFEGWHERFTVEEEALDCFSFGLSESCRLRVTYRGESPVSWAVQSLEHGTWVVDSTTALIFTPFWRRRTVVYRQNELLPRA